MVDGQGRKFNQMNDGRNIAAKPGDQRGRSPGLMVARDGKDHAPMAAQDIRPPRAAAFGLEQTFHRGAEFTQIAKTRDNDSLLRRAGLVNRPREDRAHQFTGTTVVKWRSSGLKAGLKKEQSGHASQDKATMRIRWLYRTGAERGLSSRTVKMIFPIGFIGKSKGVLRKSKAARSGFGNVVRHNLLACATT